MNKIMLSLADETYLTVSSQAKKRGISVQELLRAVIVPEWVKENLRPPTMSTRTVGVALAPTPPQMNQYHRNRILDITVGQLKYYTANPSRSHYDRRSLGSSLWSLRTIFVQETARDEEYLRLLETSTPSDNRTIVLCCDHSHDHSLRKLTDPASLLTFFQEFLEHLCIKRHM